MKQQHRYSGPELSALLDQVRRDLGAEATIHEANKVRTGGVAGFFASEEYEVVASATEPEPVQAEPELLDVRSPGDRRRPLELASVGAPPPPPPPPPHHEAGTTENQRDLSRAMNDRGAAHRSEEPPPMAARGTNSALLERAEAISIQERIQLSRRPISEPVDLRSERPAARFDDFLAAELRQPEVVVRSHSTRAFWERLARFEEAFVARDLESPIVTIVGNLSSAVTVAQRLVRADDKDARELVVLTSAGSGATADLPPWQIVSGSAELEERLDYLSRARRPAVVVIDAALGSRVKAEVERVRAAGSRLLRLAIDDDMSAKKIFGVLQELAGYVVVDVVHEAEPSYLLGLVTRRVPVVTVGGRTVDPTLLFAICNEVADV